MLLLSYIAVYNLSVKGSQLKCFCCYRKQFIFLSVFDNIDHPGSDKGDLMIVYSKPPFTTIIAVSLFT